MHVFLVWYFFTIHFIRNAEYRMNYVSYNCTSFNIEDTYLIVMSSVVTLFDLNMLIEQILLARQSTIKVKIFFYEMKTQIQKPGTQNEKTQIFTNLLHAFPLNTKVNFYTTE